MPFCHCSLYSVGDDAYIVPPHRTSCYMFVGADDPVRPKGDGLPHQSADWFAMTEYDGFAVMLNY